MESLLSGFIGALIATILTVIYMHITELSRRRSDVMLDVVTFFDEIYTLLQRLHTDKDASFTGKKRGLNDEEYRISSKNLKDILFTSRVGVKLALVYGEGDLNGIFNYLKDKCLTASRLLWSADEADRDNKSKEILTLFSEHIDPYRNTLERKLIDGTRVKSILKDTADHVISMFSKENK